MNIRSAKIEDDGALIAMGRKFYESLPYKDVAYDEASAARWLAFMRKAGVLLVAELDGKPIGMAGGLYSPFVFNDNHLVGAEILFWVEPEHRQAKIGSALLAALEDDAHSRGAIRWSMIAIEGTQDRIGKIYEREGYTLHEHTYAKRPQPWQQSLQ